jgi:hypothetical protein
MPMSVLRDPCDRGGLPGATRSTNAKARPTSSVEYSPGGKALHQSNFEPFLAGVRRLPRGGRSQLSGSRHHPPGHGQFEFTQAHGAGEAVRRENRRLGVGPVHRALHTETRQLAQPGGDRNQSVLPPVSGPEKNPIAPRIAAGNTRMEPENEPRPCHHQLAVYALKGTPEIRIQKKPNHTVRDLVCSGLLPYSSCKSTSYSSILTGHVFQMSEQ